MSAATRVVIPVDEQRVREIVREELGRPNAAPVSDKPRIRVKDLAATLGCSAPYASQIMSGARSLSIAKAIAIYDKTGHKIGPIEGATPEELTVLRKFAGVA